MNIPEGGKTNGVPEDGKANDVQEEGKPKQILIQHHVTKAKKIDEANKSNLPDSVSLMPKKIEVSKKE